MSPNWHRSGTGSGDCGPKTCPKRPASRAPVAFGDEGPTGAMPGRTRQRLTCELTKAGITPGLSPFLALHTVSMVPIDQSLCFLVEVVVLVVLRPLQGQLQGETILGNLINPHARGDLGRS